MAYSTLISAHELHKYCRQDDWVIVDCRFSLGNTEKGREDYLVSHISGARYAHLDEDLSGPILPGETGRHPLPQVHDFIEKLQGWGISQNTQVVAYDDMGGPIAARLWWMLKWIGHKHVAVLDGGFPAWTKQGYDTTAASPEITPSLYAPSLQSNRTASADEILKNLGKPGITLVDARAAQRYAGLQEPIDPIAGHIPGAVSFPFKGNLTEEGVFKSPQQLQERFLSLNQRPEGTDIVCYCGSGVTAAHNILAMVHAGFPFPRMYPGSWSEWITDQSRPFGKKVAK